VARNEGALLARPTANAYIESFGMAALGLGCVKTLGCGSCGSPPRQGAIGDDVSHITSTLRPASRSSRRLD
jgi:hypothetical protein